jgi:hypothetical protein
MNKIMHFTDGKKVLVHRIKIDSISLNINQEVCLYD